MAGNHAALTDPGRNKRRPTNQDAVASADLADDWILLVVADGVGGAFGGEIASRAAIDAVLAMAQSGPVDDPERFLQEALVAANDSVIERRKDDPQLWQMATTLVIALVKERQAWMISLGDSRGYLLELGTLQQITEDDSWVAEQVRRGVLSEEEAAVSPQQNVITRGIGVEEDVTNEPVSTFSVNPGAMILLCSDGLFRAVQEREIALLMRHGSVEDVVRLLVLRANENGGPDNIGVVVYREPVTTPTE